MKYWCKECCKIVDEDDIVGLRIKGQYYDRCPDCVDRHGTDAGDTLEPCKKGWYLDGKYIGTTFDLEKILIQNKGSIGTIHEELSFGKYKEVEVDMEYILEELLYEDWIPPRFEKLKNENGQSLPFISYWVKGMLKNYNPEHMMLDALRDKDIKKGGMLQYGKLIYAGDDEDD